MIIGSLGDLTIGKVLVRNRKTKWKRIATMKQRLGDQLLSFGPFQSIKEEKGEVFFLGMNGLPYVRAGLSFKCSIIK